MKLPGMASIAALTFFAAGAAGAEGDALYDAALDLSSAERRAQAEQSLRASGPEGIQALVRLAELGGDLHLADAALRAAGCACSEDEHFKPGKAAAFAVQLLRERPELRERSLASTSALERFLALASLADDPDRLGAALDKAAAGMDGRMARALHHLGRCLGKMPVDERLQVRVEQIQDRLERIQAEITFPRRAVKRDACEIEQLGQGFLDGSHAVKGAERRRGARVLTLTIYRGLDREEIVLDPECAIGIYSWVAARGKYPVGLLLPLLSTKVECFRRENGHEKQCGEIVAEALREQAAALLSRDLDRIDEDLRGRVSGGLRGVGRQVPSEAERARRENDFFCRSSFQIDYWIGLLGHARDGESRELAAELARLCPKSRAYSTAALVRLQDPRAIGYLEQALQSPGYVAVEQAALDRGTPEVWAEVERLAGTGVRNAGRLWAVKGKQTKAR
ncbi:MAG: hypothetical protein JXR96_25065 [Deltaproteobacteria bacterium]|nr:hypothetical protein [Deltaproteobacteria bacterium]